MNNRIPEAPPVIAPIEDNMDRPLWSVMIPVYNCLEFLREALESVLIQDPGPEMMQIEVVDDASTDGDVEALVKEVGEGRIRYFRQPINMGSLRNFETCINRSRGKWIHLLHGDDKVKPGFYDEIKFLFDKFPDIGAAFTKTSYINKWGNETHLTATIRETPGIIENWLEKVASSIGLQPPSIVIKRSVYEHLGAYYSAHYGEDWELWVRVAKHYPVAYSPKNLSSYRIHSNNITSNSLLSASTVDDMNRAISLIAPMIPDEKRKKVIKNAKRYCSGYLMFIATEKFNHNPKRYLNLAYRSYLFDKTPQTLKVLFWLVLKYISRTLNRIKNGVASRIKRAFGFNYHSLF